MAGADRRAQSLALVGWIGALGFAGAQLARLLRPTREAGLYVDEIRAATEAVARNLDVSKELTRLDAAAARFRAAATRHSGGRG